MGKDNKSENENFRQKAEELLKSNTSKSGSLLTETEMHKLFHELEVRKMELETENEELMSCISDRKRAEESLLASETRYRRLFESAKDGILILDAETGMIKDMNPFLIGMLGYSEDQFRDKAIWDIGFFKDIVANSDKFSELQKKEYVRYDDLPVETAEGRKISVEFISNSYFEDNKRLIQCNIRETTIRKQSELSLRKSESHLRTLVKTIPDLIWLKDTNGVYLSCNAMFERFFGAIETDIIGKTDYDFVDRELADFFRENDRKAMEAGKPTSNEEWVTFADDGHRAFLDTTKTPIYDSDGTLLGVLGIGRDMTERKKSEDALFKSEQVYRSLFENMLNGFAYCKMIFEDGHPQDFIYLAVNKSFEIQTGLKDVIGKKVSDVIPGIRKSDPDLFEVYGRVVLTGKTETFEIYVEALKMWYAMAVYSPGKEHFVSTFDVIDKRKNAEEVLRQSEAKFRNLINSLPDSVFVVDSRGRIVYCNENAMKTFDYSIDEMLNCVMEDLIPKHDRKQHITLRDKYFAEPKSRVMGEGKELFAQRKGGNEFPTEIMLEPVDINGNQYTLAIVRDITERKKIEHELKFQANLLSNVGQAVIATDLQGNIIYWNNAAEKIYGWSSAEVIGQNILSIIPPQSTREQATEIILELSSGKSWTGEFLAKRKDGSSFPAMVTNAPVLNSKEELAGIIGITSDITERKVAENELVKAKEKAEESDRLKSAFLANMSHEVRTPLNSIIGFSELLSEPEFDEDQRKEFIQHIIANGNNLLTVISDIMDISKMELGEIIFRKKHINTQEYVSGIYEQFSLQAETHQLELILNLPENDKETEMFVDTDRLRQIFNNLIGNALKFTTNGSIEIGYRPKSKMVEFFVKDTGIGIPASYHHKIFDRFRQVEDEKTRKYGGNGLGLAITKNLVGLMGGKIWVDSEEGKGSTFYFTLPIN